MYHQSRKLVLLRLQRYISTVPPHTTGPAPIYPLVSAGPSPPSQSKQVEVWGDTLAHTGGDAEWKLLLVEIAPDEPVHVKEGRRVGGKEV